MRQTNSSRLKDKTGRAMQAVGVLALVGLAVAAGFDQGPAPAEAAASPSSAADYDLGGMRRGDRFRTSFDSYPGSKLTPMGTFEANGNPLELSFFYTKDSTADVMRFYAQQFGKHGSVRFQGRDEQSGTVDYYDSATGSLIAVHAVRPGKDGTGSTIVFPSIVDVPEGYSLAGEPTDDLPRPPGCVTVMNLVDSGISAAGSTVTQIARGTPEDLLAFYEREMAARGWTREGARKAPGPKDQAQFLELESAAGHATISLSPIAMEDGADPESSVMIVLRKKEAGR